MKATNKILAIFLSAILLFGSLPIFGTCLLADSVAPAPATEAAVIDSGDCGYNLTWTFDDTGLLTISGTGEMSYGGSSPWYAYEDDITAVKVCDEVTSIASSAFSRYSALETADLGSGVKTIGQNAFRYCVQLTSVVLPESLTSIGAEAFSDCFKLTQINLSDTITSIGTSAFSGCLRLSELNIPAGLTVIEEGVFDGCWSMQEISIPESVTTIKNGAFARCIQLTDVYIYSRNIQMSENAIGFIEYAFKGEISMEKYLDFSDLVVSIYDENELLSQANELLGTQFATMDEVLTFVRNDIFPNGDGLFVNPELVIHGYGGTDSENYADTYGIQFECMHGNTRIINATAAAGCAVGYTGDTFCDDCDKIVAAGEIIPGTEHTPVIIPGRAATCTETGLTDGTKCSVCNEVITAQTVIPALGHTDDNSDGYCDRCNEDIRTEEPEPEPEPELNFFGKIKAFFQKIIDFFKNLFS